MVFYEKDRQVVPSHHNRSLYVKASIRNFKLRRTMVDPGCSLIIIHLSTHKAVGILRGRIVKQHVEVSGFGGNMSFTIGFINLDLL